MTISFILQQKVQSTANLTVKVIYTNTVHTVHSVFISNIKGFSTGKQLENDENQKKDDGI